MDDEMLDAISFFWAPWAILIAIAITSGCATERDALVEYPKKYEDNSIYLADGISCRKPYNFVNGVPTNCRPDNEWPDGGVSK